MTSSLDELAAYHADLLRRDPLGTNDQLVSLTAASQYRGLHDLTRRVVPEGSRVLDWGCGRGHFSYWLAREGHRVTAYSLEDEPGIFDNLERSERARLDFVRGSTEDPTSLPFPDETFDCAFSVGVLEHVRETGGNEQDALREIRRVLGPDGLIIAWHFPNRASLIESVSRMIHRDSGADGEFHFHEYRYTRRDIEQLVDTAGFDLVEMLRYGLLPRNSWNRLPRSLHHSRALTRGVDLVDTFLSRLMAPVVQNHAFVARKR